ncbi:MAG: DUF4349 domain-containing protein [Ferruginibacter sp.]|nr:DUF4349 domain-containing protein [Ferruginibacter sp.]
MRNNILLAGVLCIFLSCNQMQKEKHQLTTFSDSTTVNLPLSSSTAKEFKDSSKKFIRTADIKFKVNSVINTTNDIENICNNNGGFVTSTNLNSDIIRSEEMSVNEDSTLQTTSYNVTNSIILRVPNNKLDTTLKEIAKNISYLDYRIIKADEVSLQMFSNTLSQKRLAKNEARLINDIDGNNKKLHETINAEELLLSRGEQADNAQINNLSLEDQVKYSTVNILIYQPETTTKTIVASEKKVKVYEISFWKQVRESIQYGWSIIADLFIFIVRFWALLLLAGLIYFVVKWNRKTAQVCLK